MNPHWHTIEDNAQFATAMDYRTGIDLHMVVEKLPRADAWDWTVWSPDRRKVARSGNTLTLRLAMALAENAANGLIRSGMAKDLTGGELVCYPGMPPPSDDFQIATERARKSIGERNWEHAGLSERSNAIYAELRALDAERMSQPKPPPKA